jgi:hypothetical protein
MERGGAHQPAISGIAHYHPNSLDEFLVSGGDGRLTLTGAGRENAYGCTPFPRPGLSDFASSTASSISAEAYQRVRTAHQDLLAASLRQGADDACEAAVADARNALIRMLALQETGAALVFSASGTDAQLQTLFLLKLLSAGSLATVIVGSDQTGSGTAYTSSGRHFSQTTSAGAGVEKGAVIAGLENIESFAVGFCTAEGKFRSSREMDDAALAAIKEALARHDMVLLQTMEASKFGWKAPSDDLLDEISTRWPERVQIVADACQLRISRARLKRLLTRGIAVLVTGSKFFTGPAFSGALLVPRQLTARLAGMEAPGGALNAYATRFDWPAEWAGLRGGFSGRFNFGQWLRWEAALEEMRLYYAVPENFRRHMPFMFGESVEYRAQTASHLDILKAGRGLAAEPPTIFPILSSKGGVPLSEALCAALYRAMRREDARASACQIGQPVALPGGKAALRLSLSARMVRECWSPDPLQAERNIARMRDHLAMAIGKLDRLIASGHES